MSELDALVRRADLDGLVRLIDSLSAARDWPGLLEARDRSRAAVHTGRQLWPAATLAEYRLALWAPAEWAAKVLDEDSGRFTIGPLTEVVAQHHTFAELAPYLPDPHRAGLVAHECSLRSESFLPPEGLGTRAAGATHRVTNPLGIPFERQPWEPIYLAATYSDDGIDAPSPSPPPTHVAVTPPTAEVVDDPEVTLAVRQLFDGWTAASTGRAEVHCVEFRGDVTDAACAAVGALGVRQVEVAAIDGADALAWLAWAGAQGGAQGRRRGLAIGRFGAWAVVAAIGGCQVDDASEVGEALADQQWFWWSAGEPLLGWQVQLAVVEPGEGYAWAISAHDAR